MSNVQLIRAAQRGDRASLVQLASSCRPFLRAVALDILADPEDADDVAQDALLALVQSLPRLADPEAFWGWARTIARNRALDYLRRPKGDVLDEVADAADGPEEALSRQELRAEVMRAVADLPESARLPLALHDLEGWSIKQISESLDLSEDVVRQRLSRGRKRLGAGILASLQAGYAAWLLSRPTAAQVLEQEPPGRPATNAWRWAGFAAFCAALSLGSIAWLRHEDARSLGTGGGPPVSETAREQSATNPSRSGRQEVRSESESVGLTRGLVASPRWSHDGEHVAWLWGDEVVAIAPFDGESLGASRAVSVPAASAGLHVSGITWHPRGPLIFSGAIAGGRPSIYLADVTRAFATELLSPTNEPGPMRGPDCTGEAVAYVADGEVRIVRSPWSASEAVTRGDEVSLEPSGRHAAVTRADGLVVVDLEDGSERLVHTGPVRAATWSASGLAWLASDGEDWLLLAESGTLASGVVPPSQARLAPGIDGSVPWSDGDRLHVTRLDGREVRLPELRGAEPREPALGHRGGSILLAYTAIEDGVRRVVAVQLPEW